MSLLLVLLLVLVLMRALVRVSRPRIRGWGWQMDRPAVGRTKTWQLFVTFLLSIFCGFPLSTQLQSFLADTDSARVKQGTTSRQAGQSRLGMGKTKIEGARKVH